nr:hypothetical protein [Tanacetum cinerariifolium]
MSDSDESGVTYIEVSSLFEDLSDIGLPRADDHEHLELPGMLEDPYIEVALQAPPSPDYNPGPEEPEQAPTLPDYVLGPEHDDDEIAHPKEDDDEDPKEDPVDYPADGGDDGDDEEGSSEDDEDDDMDIEADEKEEEEEEHPAPVDSVVVPLPATDHAPFAKETGLFETDESAATPPPHPAYRMIARISILAPLPLLPPQKRLGIALGPRYEVGEGSSAVAARPVYDFVATIDREIMRDLEREVGYGIIDSWDEIVETLHGALVSTNTQLGGYMREFETRVRRDTDEIYSRLDDEQKARLSREAWVRSMDASDLARGEVMSLRTTVLGQMTEIRKLHAADRRRQIVTSEMLRADHRRSIKIRGLRTADHT